MTTSLSDFALLLSQSIELSLVAKATLILLAGLVVTHLTRSARASARHLVVASAFAALIALPVLLAAAPAMTLDVPVTPSAPAPASVMWPASVGDPIAIATSASRPASSSVSIVDVLRAACRLPLFSSSVTSSA